MTLPILDLMLPKVPTSSDTNITSIGENYKTYTIITNETTITTRIGKLHFPLTVTLKSADVTRKVDISTDNGVTYITLSADVTNANYLVYYITHPITHIKATGVAGNTLTIVR